MLRRILVIKGGWSLKRLLICLLFLLVGCSEKQELNVLSDKADAEKKEQILELIKEEDKIEKANVISLKDEWLIAVQIKPWLKFNKSKFDESFQKKLEKVVSSDQLIFSNDLKIFNESTKLVEKKHDSKKLKKELDRLRELAKEET